MASKILADLKAEVERNTTIDASATALINGIGERIKKAVAKAIENGATEEELAPIQEEIDALAASNQALADAVAANTPAEETEKGSSRRAGS